LLFLQKKELYKELKCFLFFLNLQITPMIKIKHVVSMAMLCLFSLNAMAQIKGKVVDATDNSPVIGASVTVPKTSKGVTTDADGNFSLDVPVGTSIEVPVVHL